MDVLGVSNAAAPLETKSLKRPADAPPATSPTAAAAEDARLKEVAPAQISQKNQLLVQQVDRFTFAYTFLDPDTGSVISRWPQSREAGDNADHRPLGAVLNETA